MRALKKYAPEVNSEFRRNVRAVASRIASSAKSKASWSTRIPGAIAPSVTTKGVGVRLSKKKAPHGGLYERGGQGRSNSVRHTLFGNRNFWFETPTRPFLQPAVEENRDQALEDMMRAVE